MGRPVCERNNRNASRASGNRVKCGRNSATYAFTASIAGTPIGTIRCLFPLPMTFTIPSVSLKSFIFSVPTSLARKPAAYITSNMARSRSHSAPCSAFGVSTNFFICPGVSVPGNFFHVVGRSSSRAGSFSNLKLACIQRKNTRMVAKCRTMEIGSSPRSRDK